MFLGSKNPLLVFLQSYHVRVTSKIQVDFRSNHVMSRNVMSCHVMLCQIITTWLRFNIFAQVMRQHILDSHISPRQPVVWPGRFPIKIQTCSHHTPSEEARALQIRSFKFQAYFQFKHHWQNIGTLGLGSPPSSPFHFSQFFTPSVGISKVPFYRNSFAQID